MASKRNPARIVVALGVAGALAIFFLYTSLAGGGTASLRPSQLQGHAETVSLGGVVVGPITGDAHAGGLRFRLQDFDGTVAAKTASRVRVVYTGTVPDLFGVTKHITLRGKVVNGVFVAERGSMITKCPSRYKPKSEDS